MITATGTCPSCRHPWSWHPITSPSTRGAGCVGRVPAFRLVPDAMSRPCRCELAVPRDAYRVQADPGITESELRALWGDR